MVKGIRWLGVVAVVGAVLTLSACGGSNNSAATQAASAVVTKSCQQQFNPNLAAAGDNCTPQYGVYCPNAGTQGTALTNDQSVTPCDGVTVSNGSVTAGSLTTNYVVATPTTANGASPIYIALHWAEGNGPTMVNRMRLAEIAKGRGATVVAPTAPGPVQSWGNSAVANPTSAPTSSVAERIALLTALIDQVAGPNKKVILAGDSGGAAMAFQYMCAHADRVAGLVLVASVITPSDLSGCKPNAPVPTVQVKGTADLYGPYNATTGLSAGAVPVFDAMLTNNGCDPSTAQTANMPPASTDVGISGITVQWVNPTTCSSKLSSALVTIQNGGHNWPGFHGPTTFPVNIYGPLSEGFDATLQGYDLLTYLGG